MRIFVVADVHDCLKCESRAALWKEDHRQPSFWEGRDFDFPESKQFGLEETFVNGLVGSIVNRFYFYANAKLQLGSRKELKPRILELLRETSEDYRKANEEDRIKLEKDFLSLTSEILQLKADALTKHYLALTEQSDHQETYRMPNLSLLRKVVSDVEDIEAYNQFVDIFATKWRNEFVIERLLKAPSSDWRRLHLGAGHILPMLPILTVKAKALGWDLRVVMDGDFYHHRHEDLYPLESQGMKDYRALENSLTDLLGTGYCTAKH